MGSPFSPRCHISTSVSHNTRLSADFSSTKVLFDLVIAPSCVAHCARPSSRGAAASFCIGCREWTDALAVDRQRHSRHQRKCCDPDVPLSTCEWISGDVDLAVDAVHGRDECDRHEADDETHEDDDGRLEQTGEVLDLDLELAVVEGGGRLSCLSSVPVSSPTRNIWRAAAGKRPVSASGAARPFPSIICSRMWLSPALYTALLDASAVTAMARGRSTPAVTSDARTRHTRSTMAAWRRLPATGSFRSTESSHARPCRERRNATKRRRPPPG